ncbi:Arc family DNA-binding protein [Streptomyces sp. NPDC004286]|uniref:Arc family DNA-binding protein n=1 Tax=Streptomyces sp. NPDC004286 TaxID=3364696 RepID=UPI00368231DB
MTRGAGRCTGRAGHPPQPSAVSPWCHFSAYGTLATHYSGVMDEDKRITLRLPADLHEWLVAQARSARRSLNSEIVYRLESQRDAVAVSTPTP